MVSGNNIIQRDDSYFSFLTYRIRTVWYGLNFVYLNRIESIILIVKLTDNLKICTYFTHVLVLRLVSRHRERKCSRAIMRLAQQFPGDSGAMAPLFLNYLLIAPGESFFMAANEPHAYVAGEIIECMACSDNVVRIVSIDRNFY